MAPTSPSLAQEYRPGELIDAHARKVDYLRVSVTDRCNYRCKYCMPAEGVQFMERSGLLTFEETARIVAQFAKLGVKRVRLTGGEPLLRRNLEELVAKLKAIEGISDLSMTTNAHLLARLGPKMVEAGLNRFNISLDSLEPERFKRITRGGDLARVLNGIETLVELGAHPIKINMVVMPGFNTDEIVPMVRYFAERNIPVTLRFIEYMPFRQRDFQVFSASDMEALLSEHYTLGTYTGALGGGPAQYRSIEGTTVDVGFIAPITRQFCGTCNRLRLSSDGRLRTCLAFEDTPSLRDCLRSGMNDDELGQLIQKLVKLKPEGHGCSSDEDVEKPFEGFMSAVGG